MSSRKSPKHSCCCILSPVQLEFILLTNVSVRLQHSVTCVCSSGCLLSYVGDIFIALRPKVYVSLSRVVIVKRSIFSRGFLPAMFVSDTMAGHMPSGTRETVGKITGDHLTQTRTAGSRDKDLPICCF